MEPVRDRGGSATKVHRHEYLRSVLWWDETVLDHRLDDEDADDWQQHHLRNADGDDRGYRQTRYRARDFHPCERSTQEYKGKRNGDGADESSCQKETGISLLQFDRYDVD